MVSVREYLTTSYRPDCDYLDGVLLERNLGEWDHSRAQGLISAYLFAREKQWGMVTLPAVRVQVTPTRFRVPDVCVLLEDHGEQIITHPPFLCIEMLSKEDWMSEMQERIDDYLAFGVSTVWVIDPRTRKARIYTPDASHEVKDGILRTSREDISVSLVEVFGP